MDTLIKKTVKLSKAKLDLIRFDMAGVFEKYEHGMEKLTMYKTNNTELGHDLVQTTFLKTLMYLQKGGKVKIMRSFLNHILNGMVIDEYRKRKTVSLDTLLEKGFEPIFDENEQLMNAFDGKAVMLLIPLLPKNINQLFVCATYKVCRLRRCH